MSCEDLKGRVTQMHEQSRVLLQDILVMTINGGSVSYDDMLNSLFEIKYDVDKAFDDLDDCRNKALVG